MSEEFSKFIIAHKNEIAEIQNELSIPMEDDGHQLAEQLKGCESRYGRMTTLHGFAVAFLDGAASEAWRTVEGTVTEKEAHVKAAVAKEKRLTIILEGLCRAITQRISLGQSLLRRLEQEKR